MFDARDVSDLIKWFLVEAPLVWESRLVDGTMRIKIVKGFF